MTSHPATRKARYCQASAILAAASGLYPATHHPYYAIPGLVSAAIFATVAVSYQREAADDGRQHDDRSPA